MANLEARLKARIAHEGAMPFADFMTAALYDPNDGYYARGPSIGPGGDFSTSVSFSAFRSAVTRLAEKAWQALGEPEVFRLVELGAGTGQLARHITDQWSAWARLDYVTVDASAGLRAQQADAARGIRSLAALADLEAAPGLVFGNEVLDALPVHRVVGGPAGVLEIFVDLDEEGRFKEHLHAPTAAARKHLTRTGLAPQRGQICDIQPALTPFVAAAAGVLTRGWLVFVDYGDAAERLYASNRLNGTLAAYKAHGRFHDPFADVGQRDLTCDVDFTCVAHAAVGAGMQEAGLIWQQQFLDALDIGDLGAPDEVRMVAGAANLGSAFQVAAFTRGDVALPPGF